eukprot:gnl/TRDRNA2_/TRDRNA2_31780_c0_seq2.p1 gnl/TRDRNA2_/TRDRNA2_31780_c0~~gnl/TRDRNA2_/TRDRNA2_31780_c0_seq2.p1  ORF type:complete len:656 (+),score=116.27 gnl/TRDRNA2_/TRDRNA2_31780_c0_seq2:69-2036(+)
MSGAGVGLDKDGDGGDELNNPNFQFLAVSQNLLSSNHGSICHPHMLWAPKHFREKVEEFTGQTWDEWKEAVITPEYMKHFHYNTSAGDDSSMRQLWRSKKLNSAADIPEKLTEVTFCAEDKVTYTSKAGEDVTATSLRGMLRTRLPSDLGMSLFEHLLKEEDEVYSWAVRGPRLFKMLTEPSQQWQDLGADQPHVIALQEYDVHQTLADYRGIGKMETWPVAMLAKGYNHAFFKEPVKGRAHQSGVAIYWHKDSFKLDQEDVLLKMGAGSVVVEAGHSVAGCAYNCDMMERWYPRRKRLEPTAEDLYYGENALMAASDRRNTGIARLRHRSGKTINVLVTQLCPAFLDHEEHTDFAGHVRRQDLASVRKYLKEKWDVPKFDMPFLLMGDFNSDARYFKHIFVDPIISSSTQPQRVMGGLFTNKRILEPILGNTPGLNITGGPGQPKNFKMDWMVEVPMKDNEGTGVGGVAANPDVPLFPQHIHFAEAFSEEHAWGQRVGAPPDEAKSKDGTVEKRLFTCMRTKSKSARLVKQKDEENCKQTIAGLDVPEMKLGSALTKNVFDNLVVDGHEQAAEYQDCEVTGMRYEYTDYMWYTTMGLTLVKKSDLTAKAGPYPNREHGSDHVPLSALYAFEKAPQKGSRQCTVPSFLKGWLFCM